MTLIKIDKLKADLLNYPKMPTKGDVEALDSESNKENVNLNVGIDDKKHLKSKERHLKESNKKGNVSESILDSVENLKANSNSKLTPSSPSSLVRGRPSSCVFVASLSSSKSDDELGTAVTEHFSKWGNLSTVKVLRDTCNRPYAFVQYNNDQDSKRAIKFGHNSILHGRGIRCEPAKVNRTLFLTSRNLFTAESIKAYLGKFGEVEQIADCDREGILRDASSVEVGSDKIESDSWYCMFVYRDDAIRAFANLSDENSFEVEWAQNIDRCHINTAKEIEEEEEAKPRFDKYSVFVGQLNTRISEGELKERFSLHGAISQIDLIRRPNNTFAFIKYFEESGAASAVERENHSMLCGKTMHVQYREIMTSNKHTERTKGIALAPPPINLTKRESLGGSSFRHDQKFNQKKLFHKPKHGAPFNTYNRKRSQLEYYQPKSNFQKFNPIDNREQGIIIKRDVSSKEKSASPPPTSKTNDSVSDEKLTNTLASSKISNDTYFKPKKNGKYEGNGYKHGSSSNMEYPPSGHNAPFPYYYYIPSEVPNMPPSMAGKFSSGSARLPHPPPSSYFYPQYFMPYDGVQMPFPPAPHPQFYQSGEPEFS